VGGWVRRGVHGLRPGGDGVAEVWGRLLGAEDYVGSVLVGLSFVTGSSLAVWLPMGVRVVLGVVQNGLV